MSKCENCIHADVSGGPRVIIRGNITIVQSGKNSVNCKCENIRSITITDGEMVCSEFKEKEGERWI